MRINHNHNSRPMKTSITSILIAAFACVIMIFANAPNLSATEEGTASPYTFTQKARVFDGANWNEAKPDKNGDYYYYPAGSPGIVAFELNFVVNKTTLRGSIDITNSLPEGMEYIDDSLNIEYDGVPFNEKQSLTSESRILEFRSVPNVGGLDYFDPGDKGTITFQAKFLFNSSDSCKNVSNTATAIVSLVVDGPFNMSTNTNFESSCTESTPAPNPTPSENLDEPEEKPAHGNEPLEEKPKALQINFNFTLWILVIGLVVHTATGLTSAIVILIHYTLQKNKQVSE